MRVDFTYARTARRERRRPLTLRRLALVAGAAVAPLFQAGDASAQVSLGSLDGYAIFGLSNGRVEINSASSIQGNVGYSQNVAVPNAQKVDEFIGTAYLYSGATTANFSARYANGTFNPTGGIQSGNTSGCPASDPLFLCAGAAVDARLTQANADAARLEAQLNSFFATQPVTNLGTASTNLSLTGSGGINLYDVDWAFNSNSLTLFGGPKDYFLFRSSGIGDTWAQSMTTLNGVSPDQVFFYFVNGDPSNTVFTVNKDKTVFRGVIFAPNGDVIYHNPATFDGRIIAQGIDLHSDFAIDAPAPLPPTTTVPEPGSMLLVGSGLLGLYGAARRRRRATKG